MTTREIPGDRERVEVRPGVWLWLSGTDLAAFRAKEPAQETPITAAVVVPENAALPAPKTAHKTTTRRSGRR